MFEHIILGKYGIDLLDCFGDGTVDFTGGLAEAVAGVGFDPRLLGKPFVCLY